MNNFFYRLLTISLILLIISYISIPIFFVPTYTYSAEYYSTYDIDISNVTQSLAGYFWPLPAHKNISSYFGKRTSPTTGASTYHKGIDIPSKENTFFISIMDCTISYTGFKGSGGYTIIAENNNYQLIYCHVSPNFLVSVGQKISAGQIIGQIGPKYIDNIIGNPYHDSTGKQTNGATTGSHLHFGIKYNNNYLNPLDFISPN